jgi:hypothetical protein
MMAGFALPAEGRVAQPNRERTAVARGERGCLHPLPASLAGRLPTNATASDRTWPSRRTWNMAADVLALLADNDSEAAHLVACDLVGEGAAVE